MGSNTNLNCWGSVPERSTNEVKEGHLSEARALLIFIGAIALAILLCVGFSYWQVHTSQHEWCNLLTTLTHSPVPKPPNPAANPSRETTYQFYMQLVKLRGEFGCA